MKFAQRLCIAGAFLSFAATLPVAAATLCVNTGSSGCYTHIMDAVNAAAPGDVINVGPGTYAENVVVGKALSLVASGAVIDATGLQRGIFVNGLSNPGLAAVHISGFTVKNAKMEGILILNATDVAVSGNTVTGNDRSLTASGCPNLPSYEPGEMQDCGEGIHLQAVDHSILTNNTVTNNAGGGVLVSDDTGASHHNLLSFNTVLNNPGACGISLASHIPPSPVTGSGVFQNTLYANRSGEQRHQRGGRRRDRDLCGGGWRRGLRQCHCRQPRAGERTPRDLHARPCARRESE